MTTPDMTTPNQAVDLPVVSCVYGNNHTLAVQPDAIVGGLAVHQRIVAGVARGPGWTVTHRASGKLIWSTQEFGEAVRVAQWLDDRRTIPEGHSEAVAWRAGLSTVLYARLIEDLQAIAPRYDGNGNGG